MLPVQDGFAVVVVVFVVTQDTPQRPWCQEMIILVVHWVILKMESGFVCTYGANL